MFTESWHYIIVAAAVVWAAAVVARRAWRLLSPGTSQAGSACGGCGTCVQSATDDAARQSQAFVPLEVLKVDGDNFRNTR